MLKHLITSVTGRVVIIFVAIELGIGVMTPILHLPTHWTFLSTFLLLGVSSTIWAHNSKFAVRIFSWMFPGKYFVELVDHRGDSYFTLATKRDGIWQAPVYFGSNVGQVILNDDGTVGRNSESNYIYYWLPVNKSKRVIHVLTNNIPV
jgi:hypothetical protein